LRVELLEQIRVRYAHAARMGNDLMSRLEAIEAERAQWQAALDRPDVAARARLELNEIDHLRPRIERSARQWVDRARALELIVAACLAQAQLPLLPPVVRDSRVGGHVQTW
jgi:hypothetical protein